MQSKLSYTNGYLECIAATNSFKFTCDYYIEFIDKFNKSGDDIKNLYEPYLIFINQDRIDCKIDLIYSKIEDWNVQIHPILEYWILKIAQISGVTYSEERKKFLINYTVEILEELFGNNYEVWQVLNGSDYDEYAEYVIKNSIGYYILHFHINYKNSG